jgi:hypothetical protein
MTIVKKVLTVGKPLFLMACVFNLNRSENSGQATA